MPGKKNKKPVWLTPEQLINRQNELINNLQTIYCNIDLNVIKLIANQYNYDQDQCIEVLSNMSNENANNGNDHKINELTHKLNNTTINNVSTTNSVWNKVNSNSTQYMDSGGTNNNNNNNSNNDEIHNNDSNIDSSGDNNNITIIPRKVYTTFSLVDNEADNYVNKVAASIISKNNQLTTQNSKVNQPNNRSVSSRLTYEQMNPLPHQAVAEAINQRNNKGKTSANKSQSNNNKPDNKVDMINDVTKGEKDETLDINNNVSIDRSELLELFGVMFESLDKSIITAIVDSLNTHCINLVQLNECVETLINIDILAETNSQINNDNDNITVENDNRLAQELHDFEYAKQLHEQENDSNINISTDTRKKKKNPKIKFDLHGSATINRWQFNQNNNNTAPTLTAKFGLDALVSAFVDVEYELISQAFIAQNFDFNATKSYLLELFPDSCKDINIKPLPQQLIVRQKQIKRQVQTVEEAKLLDELENKYNHQDNSSINNNLSKELYDELEYYIGRVLDNKPNALEPFGHINNNISNLNSNNINLTKYDYHSISVAKSYKSFTEALFKGDHYNAKQYAQNAKHQFNKYKNKSQSIAVYYTFYQQNNELDSSKIIDLHGLNVEQALNIVKFIIYRGKCVNNQMCIICGKGNNSLNGRARLRPAIENYCKTHNIKVIHINDGEIKIIWK